MLTTSRDLKYRGKKFLKKKIMFVYVYSLQLELFQYQSFVQFKNTADMSHEEQQPSWDKFNREKCGSTQEFEH